MIYIHIVLMRIYYIINTFQNWGYYLLNDYLLVIKNNIEPQYKYIT